MAVVTVSPSTVFSPSLPNDYGWFGWNIARGTAVWSDSVRRLHGYEAGRVIPSSALTFHHKHSDDLYGCVDALHAGMVQDRLIVHEHRVVVAAGQTRPVVMICRSVGDSQGRTRNLRGFLLSTDADPAEHLSPVSHEAALLPVLMDVFEISSAAAHVLYTARRPMTARRSDQQREFAQRYAGASQASDRRGVFEDSLFPLEHLTLGHTAPEPLDLAA